MRPSNAWPKSRMTAACASSSSPAPARRSARDTICASCAITRTRRSPGACSSAAGCQLVAQCDLAIAAEEARFATSGINVGLFCATPAVPLARAVPAKAALELLLTGAFVDAHRAAALGLVNRVVPGAALDAAIDELADAIAARPPVAIREGKRFFHEQLALPLHEAYARATSAMVAQRFGAEGMEGIAAFVDKRPPRWPAE
jgi:enoyl-CoA hydratase/carnithine racemase